MESILQCCLPCGKAGGLQILCCQGINLSDYNFNLDALALKPSDFCNVRVYSSQSGQISKPVNSESFVKDLMAWPFNFRRRQ
jgi:hypothetical protein